MNTIDLEYLIDLYKTGNIAQTANNFYVSSSAISQCLKKEEKLMGQKLFKYENKKMVPTPAGIIFLEYIQKILQVSQTIREEFDQPS